MKIKFINSCVDEKYIIFRISFNNKDFNPLDFDNLPIPAKEIIILFP